ncbi:S-adenosyl-L-methionine-dependent methyltransferase [Rhypophila decipiens]|uniref:S-adenosyl-L-methionine-dependent methyltransferase n=1 Tax=Rhypophila decipiens TaxID=261697 RepID=A0AAN6Y2I5_9PEZI|nr:S-adenosyl-L-methionine-dependent methyltransferase [Rhypophila decipiens]
MPEQSRIVQLSNRIATNTAKFDAYLGENSIPTPSFSAKYDQPSPLPTTAPPEILAARKAILQDTLELRQLMLGPREHVLELANPNALLSQLVIARLGLASLVPLDDGASTTTFSAIASTTGLSERNIRRLIRHAISQRVFVEGPSPGQVSHSAASRLLAREPDMWPDSHEPEHTGFALAHDTEKPIFEYLASEPERAARFAAGMRLYANRPGTDVRVDVGGSHGQLGIQLAWAFPGLKHVVVQDIQEAVIEAASANMPEDLAGRLSYMVHDFFTEQPGKSAAVYVFRACFHNWSDKYAVKMLEALKPALEAGVSHVVINDVVVPDAETLKRLDQEGKADAAHVRSADLAMGYLMNAGDRELGDWKALFEMAGPGFEFLTQGEEYKLEGSDLGMVVAKWVGVGGSWNDGTISHKD